MGSGLQVQVFDSEHELHFGGVEQLIAKSFHIRGQEVLLDRPCSRVMVGTAPDNEGSRLVRTWFPCRRLCGRLQQFVEMVLCAGIGLGRLHCAPLPLLSSIRMRNRMNSR